MTPGQASAILATEAFQIRHRKWADSKDTQEMLAVLRTVLCRPVLIPIEKVTAENSIYGKAFSDGAFAFADALEDISSLREMKELGEETFGPDLQEESSAKKKK
jgi:hypothetical protein